MDKGRLSTGFIQGCRNQPRYGMISAMTPSQCRAARALVDLSQDQLASRASVSVTALRNFERGATTPMANNLLALRAALEAAGVEFIPENGGGAGVRLKAPRA